MTVAPSSLSFLLSQFTLSVSDCYELPTNQQRIFYLNSQRTPQWVSTAMHHGMPKLGQVPVKKCGIVCCVNGAHYRWGTQAECNAARRVRPLHGEGNPNAKLDNLIVSQLRCVDWGYGYWKPAVARALGVSVRTLVGVIEGRSWPGIEPYKGGPGAWRPADSEDEF